VNRALLLLLFYSVRGRVVRSVRLLRQPRYLIGLVVFIAWMGLWVGTPAANALLRGGRLALELPEGMLRLVQLGAAILFAAGLTVTWLLPRSRMHLGLSAAEIELLSPAPVCRRELIQHAIVKRQAGILFGAGIMTLLMGFGGLAARLLWFVSFWLVLTNVDLHGMGRTLFKARLGELPARRARTLRILALAGGVAFWGVVVFSVAGPAMRFSGGLPVAVEDGAVGKLVSATELEHGAHRWALAPFLWLLEPPLAALRGVGLGSGRVVLALLFGLGLVLLQNEWVVRSQFKFEEAALKHARRQSAKRDPRSRYRRLALARRTQCPFDLAPSGAPGAALLWKSLLQVRRSPVLRVALVRVGLAMAIALALWLSGAPPWLTAAVLSLGVVSLAMLSWLIPLHDRNDLRSDLLSLEIIRPWPLPGWRVFAWEALGPAIGGLFAVGFAACLVVFTDIAMQLGPAASKRSEVMAGIGLAGPLSIPLLVIGLLPLAAALSFLTAVLVNLVALYMPGWVQLSSRKPRGAAAFGHNLLLSIGMLVVCGPILVVAAALVGFILFVQLRVLGLPFGSPELPLLGLVAALPVAVAAAVGVGVGGFLWDNLDASCEVLDPS
jgi:hypothetical protein